MSSRSIPHVIIPLELGNHWIEVKAAAYDSVYTDGVKKILKVVVSVKFPSTHWWNNRTDCIIWHKCIININNSKTICINQKSPITKKSGSKSNPNLLLRYRMLQWSARCDLPNFVDKNYFVAWIFIFLFFAQRKTKCSFTTSFFFFFDNRKCILMHIVLLNHTKMHVQN